MKKFASELSSILKDGTLEEISNELGRLYLETQFMLAKESREDLKELTVSKKLVELDNGGKYHLVFLHIEGPKVKLRD